MLKRTSLFVLFVKLLSSQPVFAQDGDTLIEFSGYQWRVAAAEAELERYLGREALRLQGGRVIADGVDEANVVISFDAAFSEQQSFIGAGWRAVNDANFEEMYFRAHLNNEPDALQYTPVHNRLSAWQIFHDGNAIAPVTHRFTDWNQVKIVVLNDRADIYYNSETPVLHVPDLKRELSSGAVNLRVTGQGTGPVYFSNVTIRPLQANEGIVGEPQPMEPLPQGLIAAWEVSEPFSESRVADRLELGVNESDRHSWRTTDLDTNGIANLAKLSGRTREQETVFVRQTIQSDADQLKAMQFGYSDRVRLYLNGKQVFSGIAGWRSRNFSFMGLVGFSDTVVLDLHEGENELLVAVSETFGGWAWAAAIADRSGIQLQN
ncbi:MAG: hypothetical protein MI746_12140 [Pseudomonadales bacterium]|nr:hypothetical protein [Pseudomonadales bacterium]